MWAYFAIVIILMTGVGIGNSNTNRSILSNPLNSRLLRTNRSPTGSSCEIRINEINSSRNKSVPSLFIELRRVCMGPGARPPTTLDGYFLLLIRGRDPAVVMYIDLGKQNFNVGSGEEMFLIGAPGLPRVDLTFAEEAVESVFKNPSSDRFLPKGDDSAYGILLLHCTSKSQINWLRLVLQDGQYGEYKLSGANVARLNKLNLKDLVVFGREPTIPSCDIFDVMRKDKKTLQLGKTYLLRDFHNPTNVEYSLSRCNLGSGEGIIQPSLQYDAPSPGLPNPCNGKSIFLESVINRVAPLENTSVLPTKYCQSSVPDIPIPEEGYPKVDTFETGCGGIMRNPTGVIQSPGYPEVYPHGLRCMWVIRGKPGQVVRLTWDMFRLEGGSNCLYDYVDVYDNSTSTGNGSFVGKFCGSVHPPILTSLDTTLIIIFKSDHSESYDGFMASYQLLNGSTACGGNYFTKYGMLKSPRYPENYPNGLTCTWVITAPRGRQIELNVMDFAMENGTSSGCTYDYLEIRNGPYETSPLVGKFCGGRPTPPTILSFSNSLYLKFQTDSSHAGRGFQINWDANSTGCGGVLNSPSGSISSPNYPSPHEGGMECLWKIQANQGNLIQLMFVDLDLQPPSSAQCWGEHVEVLDGSHRNSPSMGKFCSKDQVIPIQSTGNVVTLKLVGNGLSGGGGRGFLLNYKILCNRTLKGFHGVIESPNYPNLYPHNSNCSWTIQAGRGNKVNISFSHFDVEAVPGGNCSYDFVQISELNPNPWRPYKKTAIGTYCGSSRPGLISSTNNTAAISFLSDHSQAGNGFRLEWANYGCGGRVTGDRAVLNSPDYPAFSSRDIECVWEVTTEPGTNVQLTVYHLDAEGGNCDWDSLEVYGGSDETTPLLSKLCTVIRESSPTILSSYGNRMYIRFQSNGGYAANGFFGRVGQASGGCGGTLQSKSGYIYSPNYPRDYEPDDECSWVVRTDENHVVELTFEDFVVERHTNCSYDHVAIYDGASTTAPLLLMHCGSVLPEPNTIRSSGNEMLIHLKTDGSAAGRGFKALYKQGCGARIKGRQSGEITSPNYPGRMLIDGSGNCSWIIEGQPDERVTLTFTFLEFDNAGREECGDVYLEVLDGDHFGATSLYKGCTGGVPPALTSRGNTLILNAVASHYYGSGFRAIYDLSSSACGGTFNTGSGSFTSPNYPNGYPPNVECIWLIKTAPGNHVQMAFRRFDIEPSEFCNSDFVEIHEGSAGGPLLGHFCGNDIPSNVTAVEKLWVRFRTDGEGQAPGFWADFNLVHGGELSGSQGSVASPMYPETFRGPGEIFTWLVTVNETFGIQISFSHYQMDPYDNGDLCEDYDTIKIFDGPDENARILLAACNRTLPDPVVSTGNVVYIQYIRRGWFTSFRLEWEQVKASFPGMSAVQPNITGSGGTFLLDNSTTTLLNPESELLLQLINATVNTGRNSDRSKANIS